MIILRNIPLFTTDNGIASITLEEIPYRKEAYIVIQSCCSLNALLVECVQLAKAAGAERIYATGHLDLRRYTLHTEIWEMERDNDLIPAAGLHLEPVREDTLDRWTEIYNRAMDGVPNAATMTMQKKKSVLEEQNGYFVYKNSSCVGIGKAKIDRVEAIVSLEKGAGADVLSALAGSLTGDKICVEVASKNERAVHFYLKNGFKKAKVVSQWYIVDV